MASQKLVVGRRLVDRKYRDAAGKECVVQEWEKFSEYMPLSKADIAQRAIDEAEHLASIARPAPKSQDEIIKELQERVAALEGKLT